MPASDAVDVLVVQIPSMPWVSLDACDASDSLMPRAQIWLSRAAWCRTMHCYCDELTDDEEIGAIWDSTLQICQSLDRRRIQTNSDGELEIGFFITI